MKIFQGIMLVALLVRTFSAANKLISSPNDISGYLIQGLKLLKKAEEKQQKDPAISSILTDGIFFLRYACHFAKNDFMKASETSIQWGKSLRERQDGGSSRTQPILAKNHMILQGQGTALGAAAGYGEITNKKIKGEILEKAVAILRDAMSSLQNSDELKKDGTMGRIQGDLAHTLFLQGKETESMQWLERMRKTGGESQIEREKEWATTIQKRTGVSSGYDHFLAKAFPSHPSQTPKTGTLISPHF